MAWFAVPLAWDLSMLELADLDTSDMSAGKSIRALILELLQILAGLRIRCERISKFLQKVLLIFLKGNLVCKNLLVLLADSGNGGSTSWAEVLIFELR